MIHHATQRLIDSVWTVTYKKINETQVEILSYKRDNPIGYEQEKQLDRMNFVEGEGRIVQTLLIEPYESSKYWAGNNNPTAYKVLNPRYIFSYGG